jgi:hypothetical protein
MPKLTFSLDDETVRTLRLAAERHRKPQSLIVREAIAQYDAREHTLSGEERERLLGLVRGIKSRRATRTGPDVDRELLEIRRSRRSGWSRRVK